ncbi:MAG: hypothetical protein GY820_43740 [Gammaproteobacteria bacterium]|nr:hypothetical protein [Gammaproteobacteria bacterium]
MRVATMNIPAVSNTTSILSPTNQSATEGIRAPEQRFERNVAEVAGSDSVKSHDADTQDRALVEQGEIVRAVKANARSLVTSNQLVGTLVDVKV